MVKISAIALALAATPGACASKEPSYDHFVEESLSLLQLRAQPVKINSTVVRKTRSRESPGAAERKLCPHEIEDAVPPGDVVFGCNGKLRAVSTVQCSFWGEPHITATFPSPRSVVQRAQLGIDVFYIPGLYRAASAADGSWEVQMFNCGTYACAMAARLGKDIIEILVNKDGDMEMYVNGQRTNAGQEVDGVKLDSTHRHIVADMFLGNRRPVEYPGTCFEDPGGQIMIDLCQSKDNKHTGNAWNNINLHIVAQSDAVTTKGTDGNAFCNEATGGAWRWDRWDSQPVPVGQSLFVSQGTRACEGCQYMQWMGRGDMNRAKAQCAGLEGDLEALRLDRVCAAQKPPIAVAAAETACEHLRDTPDFFNDCQLDYCFSGGKIEAVADAEGEEAVENPQPICSGAAPDDCDPASACCNALRDGSTLRLDNVVQNNMCGTDGGHQELRFGRALTQNGVDMDLVVRPVGDYDCGRVTNEKFGSKTEEIGLLAVQAGTEAEFEFNFVRSGTSDSVAPQSLMISVLDLDQGKNGKQRESVTMCGGGGVIVTDDSELEVLANGECTTVTSTTHGTGKDNPTSVAGMSQIQRGRTAAFPVTGASFTAKFSVSSRGHNPRRFMFTGHPSVACVLA